MIPGYDVRLWISLIITLISYALLISWLNLNLTKVMEPGRSRRMSQIKRDIKDSKKQDSRERQ